MADCCEHVKDLCLQFIALNKCTVLNIYMNVKEIAPTCFGTCIIFLGSTIRQF